MDGTLKTLPVHDGSKFDWHGHTGVTEASTLGPQFTGRVWPDSADLGFAVRSHRTGRKMLFTLESEEHDKYTGDILCTTYRSTNDIVIRIYND